MSCYDVSTDEEINNPPSPPPEASTNDNGQKNEEKELEKSSDDAQRDHGENEDAFASNDNEDEADREEVEKSDDAHSDHGENAVASASDNNEHGAEEKEAEKRDNAHLDLEENEHDQSANNNGNRGDASVGQHDGDDDSDADSVDIVLRDEYDYNGNVAFCCQNCRCWETSEAKFMKLLTVRNNCGNSDGGMQGGNTQLFHRGCCHNDSKSDADYLSPMMKAMNESFDGNNKKKKPVSRSTAYDIKRMYDTAKRDETQYENEECLEEKVCSNYSNDAYCSCSRKFQQRNKARRRPLRVLELFSGIGSGTVVLKRLKLPIDTIVHVEHDPVAIEVCKSNHQNDEITHVYVETFEEIYGENDEAEVVLVSALVEKYGPFDLVLSGAPCQSYSGLNASRDQNSDNAQYLKKVGRLIQKLDDVQLRTKEKVLFLSENVVFHEHKEVDECYTDQAEGGLTPIRIDAKDFGPTKRNRFYWMNIPVNSTDHIKEVASMVSADSLLDEGFGAVARLLQDEDEMSTPVKANAFLASLSRIDDNRMMKYEIEDESTSKPNAQYLLKRYSVGERERMMGFPTGYVEKPVRNLFTELTTNAFLLPETSEEGKTYRDFLDRDFWHYRKECQFKFKPNSEPPFFQLALSSPQEGKSQNFYMQDQYCKHLVGNAWSIPVVEHLLGRLVELFDNNVLSTYDGYADPHPWEPYLSM